MAREQRDDAGAERGWRFGEELRRRREEAGLSQDQLAERAGLSTKAIGALERGERRRPHPQTLDLLATAMGLEAVERRGLVAAALGIAALPAGRPVTKHNLPLQLTSFVGRERELAEVIGRLSDATEVRLLTLTGTGGCGKTRLALQAGAALLPRFLDGIWLVELAPLGEPELVPPSVAAALLADLGGAVESLEALVQPPAAETEPGPASA